MNIRKFGKNICATGLALIVMGGIVSFAGERWLQRQQKQYNENIFESLNREMSGDTGRLRQNSQKLMTLKKTMMIGGAVFLLVGSVLLISNKGQSGDLA